MSTWGWGALWFLVGFLVAYGHLLWLRHSIERVAHLPAHEASRRIVKGFPLRLLVFSPVLFVAARAGLEACLGLLFGSLVGRWWVYHRLVGAAETSGADKRG
ncbi:MAG: hypothetical protein J7M05_10605 [Anaerolineae bacterium]|nr:hypothetical protein [Anaerolineae bacterium]